MGLVLFGTLILDQVSKSIVRANMDPGDVYALIPGLIDITYVRNMGGAFGLLAGYRYLFIGVMVLVVVGVAIYWRRVQPTYVWVCVALGLVTAGAVGNAIDRLQSGLVTDFIDVLSRLWPVFNVADASIVVGVGMLLVWLALAPEEYAAEQEEATDGAPAEDAEHG
jgi:signal peptidase II